MAKGFEYRIDGGSPVDVGDAPPVPATGLTANTSYDFEVRKRDEAGNVSAWSPVVTQSTLAASDVLLDTSQYQLYSSGTPWTFSHTCTGNNRYLLVAVTIQDGTITGLTYGGVAMTQLIVVAQSTLVTQNLYIFGLVNPASGANTVSITRSGPPSSTHAVVSSWTNVNQTTPIGTPVSTNNDAQDGATISVVASSAEGEIVVDAVMCYSRTMTIGAGQTSLGSSGSAPSQLDSSYEAGAASVTMSWTLSSNQIRAIAAVALKPV